MSRRWMTPTVPSGSGHDRPLASAQNSSEDGVQSRAQCVPKMRHDGVGRLLLKVYCLWDVR
jgi:hypothetical protein